MTPKEIFAEVNTQIQGNAEDVKNNIDGIFKFIVNGDNGGTWLVDCRDVEVREGDGDADCTITVEAPDFIAIKDGSMDAMEAFMMGKIIVDGDMGLAMKLQEIL